MSQLATLTRAESRLFLRDWAGIFFIFALPLGLLAIFSVTASGDTSDPEQNIPASFLPTMAIGIGIGLLGLGSLPMVLASYWEKGVLRRLSTTPVRPVKLLIAQLLLHLASAAVVIALIVGVGTLAFGAELPGNLGTFGVAALLYCVSVFSIGLLIAAVLSTGKGASVVGNVLFFPLMFFAGVWTPGNLMPESIRFLRDVTPMGAGMSAMQDAWAGGWPDGIHVIWMLVVTVVGIGVAARLFRWE